MSKLAEAIQEQTDNALNDVRETFRRAIESERARIIQDEKDRQEAEKARIEAEKPDAFDAIDIFDTIEEPTFKPYIAPPRVEIKITDDIRALIAEQVAAAIAQIPQPKPETKIIKETIKMPEKVIVKEMIDNSAQILKEAEKRIKKEIDALDKSGRFGPIVVPSPIADQNGNAGKFLTTNGSTTKWATVTATGGGSSPDAYTANNVTTTRTFDATLTSLDEIANVLGSLITSLQGAGIIQ